MLMLLSVVATSHRLPPFRAQRPESFPFRSTGDGRRGLPMTRNCVLCGASLKRYRRHARYCSGACRAEASRLRAILNGSESVPYSSIAERMDAAQKRTRPL
jgi:hypothetical protein